MTEALADQPLALWIHGPPTYGKYTTKYPTTHCLFVLNLINSVLDRFEDENSSVHR